MHFEKIRSTCDTAAERLVGVSVPEGGDWAG